MSEAALSPDEPEYYILIASTLQDAPNTKSIDIIRSLVKHQTWLASRFTPFRAAFKKGDRVLFYAAGQGFRYFAGNATISAPTESAGFFEKEIAAKLGLVGFEQRIPLLHARIWQKPVPIQPILDRLRFVKDKQNYGLNLRQAAVRISRTDYETITSHADGDLERPLEDKDRGTSLR